MQNRVPRESLYITFALPPSNRIGSLLRERRPKLKLTSLEEATVLQAVKEQAVATAKFWDVPGQLELKYGIEFDTDPRKFSEVAVSCDSPPSVEDLRTLRLADVLELLPFNIVDISGAKPRNPMPNAAQWKLYLAIETAQKVLMGCKVDEADDHYEPAKRLRLQLRKVQRLLGQMWAESETMMRHVSKVELHKKKLAQTDSDHSQ